MSKKLFILMSLTLLLGIQNTEAQISFSITGPTTGCVPFQLTFQSSNTNGYCTWIFTDSNGQQSRIDSICNPSKTFITPGTYDVKLIFTDINGNSSSVEYLDTITATSPPQPSFSATPTTVCFQSAPIVFANNTSGSYDSLMWDFGDGTTFTTSNTALSTSHMYSSAGTFDVKLFIYKNGCSSSATANNYITILSNPATAFSADTLITCNASQAITFNALTSGSNYEWHFGDGATVTTAMAQQSHTYNIPGVYTVTLITANALGCRDTAIMADFITILSNPVPPINVSSGLNVCAPVTPIISTNTANVFSYQWNFGNSQVSSLPDNSVTFSAGNYNVSLITTYNNGCVNRNTVTYNVRPLTSAHFTTSTNAGCAPLTVTLTHQYPTAGLTYSWQLGDGHVDTTGPSLTYTYTSPGYFNPILTVTNSFGCSNTTNGSLVINVAASSAQFTADDIDGCPPHMVNFSHPGGAGYTYLWNFGDGQTSSQQNPSHTYVNAGNYTASLTVTNSFGCTNSYALPSQINVSSGVNNFAPSDTVYACAPYTANLLDNSTSSNTWLWNFGDGGTANTANAIHTYQQPGVYNVTLQTQSNGTSCSQYINPFITYVLTTGEANFSVVNSVCPPYTSYFNDSSTNAVAWFWDFGDGTTSNDTNPQHTYANPGMYNVSLTITTAGGCTFTTVQAFAANFVPLAAYPTDSVISQNPYIVQYYANSTAATSWLWNFGDGTTSNDTNPLHQYPAFGIYDLTLTIGLPGCSLVLNFPASSGGCCTPLNPPPGVGPPTPPVINVPDPVAGCAPFSVNFHSPFQNAVSVQWDFGDNTGFSNQLNPNHVYAVGGVYDVNLMLVNTAGDTTYQIWPDYVTVNAVSADFTFSANPGCTGSSLTFNNASTQNVSYLWQFGDGGQSNLFEPTHLYNSNSSNHLISLSVTDSLGCRADKSVTYYGSGSNPIYANKRRACKNEVIMFASNNPGYASYLWSFGNGDTSTFENPVYTYTSGGTFSVTLTVLDSNQCSMTFNLGFAIEINDPNADFSLVVSTNACFHPTVNFTNTSTGATSYIWNFGNGNLSSAVNPVITISSFGPQNATLIAFSGSCSDTMMLSGYYNRPRDGANFTYTQDRICFPITATFTDLSPGAVSWLWDFGDGQTDTVQNPIHVFLTQPTTNITLKTWNALGCMRVVSKVNIQSMNVSFTNVSDSVGCAPYPFHISGISNVLASWKWSFGNGHLVNSPNTINATASTTYLQNGTYPVSVFVTAPTGCVQTFDTLLTVDANGPTANFSLLADSSCAPTIVDFYDNSTGATSWQWVFGNGNQSNLENPTHVYNVPGNYNVSLVVSDDSGCKDTLTQNQAVQVTGTYSNFASSNPSGCAPWSVSFTDSSVNASSWVWDFGDGLSSVSSNPTHTYMQPGVYAVILITYDSSGCSSAYQLPDSIRVGDVADASFTVQGSGGCAPYTTGFVNTSTNAVSYHWDFGDGNTSNSQSPTHQYAQGGTYWVTLIAESANGCTDTFQLTTPMVIGNVPVGSIISSATSGCAPLQATFNPSISNTDSTTQYIWSFNGNSATGSGFNTIITQNGNHPISLVVINQGGCSATFNASVNVYGADTLGPVVMRSASVLDAHSVELKWADIIHPELDHYRIYRKNNQSGAFNLIHTSYNTLPVNPDVYQTWVDQTASTGSQTNTYLVQAVNICNLAAPLNSHIPHTTLNLEVDMVSSTPNLNWNDYGGAQPAGYLIQRRDDINMPWNVLTTVPASVNNYVDSTVYCADSVEYRVTALDLNGLSIFDAFSDVENVMAPGSLLIQRVDMVRSTVEDDSWVLTEWSHPTLAPQLVTGYELYRSTDNTNFSRIATLPAVQTSYEDRNVSVKSQNYYYRVKVSNACSLEASPGYESSSILLLANPDPRYGVNLRWTSYKNWDTGVEEYVIEEWNSSTGTWQYVKTVDGTTTETGVQ